MADVYCFGHLSTGKILRLRDRFPAADGYGEVVETLENHSGEATGTALVLANLGVSVVLEGNWIGDVPECRRTLEFLRGRGIDCSGLAVKPGYAGVTEIVISDGHTRTVFGRYCDLLFTTPQWEPPNEARIAAARIASVDPAFGAATLAVAQAAGRAGIPLVSCDARHDAPLTAACAALVVSREMMLREYPAAAADREACARLFDAYLERCPGLVVFTAGTRPVWFGRGGAPRREVEPFRVEVVDSAGAGDSFRGGLIYGMLRGWNDEACVRFACAVAALICTTAPGCVHPPALGQLEAFLLERGWHMPPVAAAPA
jgi:sugar/nucleoside kinase (ribokinase family)